MATYMPSPGPFKGADANPEATLELFGDEVSDLFKYVGKVLQADTYQQAVEKGKNALKKRGNRTSAVFKLNTHSQGSQLFDLWYKEIRKAAQLIDWTDYNADEATVDAIVMQTYSNKLQQRAIQENPSYDEIVNLGITQEQAKKKASKLLHGESEAVNRLQTEVHQLKTKLNKNSYGRTTRLTQAARSRRRPARSAASTSVRSLAGILVRVWMLASASARSLASISVRVLVLSSASASIPVVVAGFSRGNETRQVRSTNGACRRCR